MIGIREKSKVKLHWSVSAYDYSLEKANSIAEAFAAKYGIDKGSVKVVPEIHVDEMSSEITDSKEIINGIQNPQFQLSLFKDYLSANNIEDYDFDIIESIDAELNGKIDYQVYDKYRRYRIKWVKWDNFLSYGPGNFFDFTNMGHLVLLSGEPMNQSGKSTFAIDLIHFLLFGKTKKAQTQDKIFNKHDKAATQVVVEGCIEIDGDDYVIRRVITRPQLANRTSRSKSSQKVEYYRIIGDTREELEDVDEQHGENTAMTNQAIKEAIGNESDFDLIMCVTDSTLDDLVNKKDTERGRLLSRWLGLLSLEEKDKLAREKYNGDVKPYLLSNRYNEESLKLEIEAFELTNKSRQDEIAKLEADSKRISADIEEIDKSWKSLSDLREKVDEDVMMLDITSLNHRMEKLAEEGKQKNETLAETNSVIESIGEVEFSVGKYDEANARLMAVKQKVAQLGERYKTNVAAISALKRGEFCPTCGRKLDNVDNSGRIMELTEENNGIAEEGKRERKEESELTELIESMKNDRTRYEERNKAVMKRSALELNIERLRNEYKECKRLLKEYNKNKGIIDKNNKLDIELRNLEAKKKDKNETLSTNIVYVDRYKNEIESNLKGIADRKDVIAKLTEERKLLKNWAIYLDMVGKNGISKMVIRKTIPIINTRLSMLLGEVCDFGVEVGINSRNEVQFYLIKDGVYSDLSSGSGFELTASALALRAVLADMSTIPRMNILVLDEIWGRVSVENYDNMKNLIEAISRDYDSIIVITHLNDIKDLCDNHIVVRKENNVSKIISAGKVMKK